MSSILRLPDRGGLSRRTSLASLTDKPSPTEAGRVSHLMVSFIQTTSVVRWVPFSKVDHPAGTAAGSS